MSIIIKSGSSGNLANVDSLGNLYVVASPAAISSIAAPWNSATIDQTTQVLLSTGGFPAIIVQLNQTSTITGGAVTFEGTFDGINWQSLPANGVLDPLIFAISSNPYTLQPNTNYAVLLIPFGRQQVRVRLHPTISGTGQVQIYWTLLQDSGTVTVIGTVAVTQSTSPWVVSGTVTANAGTGNFTVVQATAANLNATVVGSLTHNNAAPTTNNIGALVAVASTAAPTYNTGDQVLLSTDLTGALRVNVSAIVADTVNQGNQGTIGQSWFTETTDGTSALGTFANYGTSPGAVKALGVNAFVTNTVPVTLTSTTITGTVAVTQSTSPWVVSNGGTFAVQATANVTQVAGTTLDATAVTNFGTAPAAAAVPGVNASIYAGVTGITATGSSLNVDVTNTVPVTLTSTTITGTVAVTQSTSPWVVNQTQSAGVSLGATAVTNFGTAPAAAAVAGTNASIYAGTTGLTATGTSLNVNITNAAGPFTVAGNLSNNNAAPIADNVGVLGFLANGTAVGTAPSPETYTNAFQDLAVVTTGGSQVVIPADEYYASSVNNFGVDTGITINNPTGYVPLISIRTASAAVNFLIRSIQGFTNGALGVFRLVKNATLTGSTFAATSPSANMTVDTAATTLAAGTQIWSGYAGTGTITAQALTQYMAAGAPGDHFTLAWQKVGSGTANPYGAINWSEETVVL